MTDVVSVGTGVLSGGVLAWLGNVVIQSFRSRDRRYEIGREADLKLEAHRDGLTFQLLETARIELASLRTEVQRLRPMESHLVHFEESLRYIDLLLFPGETPLEEIRRDARAFLVRVRRMQEATGTIRNEVQRLDSTTEMARRGEQE